MADKPNIILIFPDQHRGDTMGCVGHPAVKTPNLDRIAAEGATFGRCYTNSPLCMPARASLISGQYVNEHGVWNVSINGDRDGPSHVKNIRDAGYHTAEIGKTHLYSHHGAGHTENHVDELRDWGYLDTHELTGPHGSATVDSPYTDYLAEKQLLDALREYLRTYLRRSRSGELHPWETPPSPLPSEEHVDMYTARKSAEWIHSYQGDKPFYLQACFPGPHDPFDSPPEYRDMYDPDKVVPGIMDAPVRPVSPLVERFLPRSGLGRMALSHSKVMRTYYYANVSLIDCGVGLILKALEERGLMDNTWIIYTSDHGEMLGDHRLVYKMVFYEGAIHVPCIIRPPGGIKGWKCKGLTDLIDVGATLLDIAGAKSLEASDGRSHVSQIQAGPDAPDAHQGKEVIFSELLGYSMVRNEQYKMSINTRTRQPVDLYDMESDPNELHNLVGDPSLEKVRQALLNGPIDYLLSHLSEAKLKTFEDMGSTM